MAKRKIKSKPAIFYETLNGRNPDGKTSQILPVATLKRLAVRHAQIAVMVFSENGPDYPLQIRKNKRTQEGGKVDFEDETGAGSRIRTEDRRFTKP